MLHPTEPFPRQRGHVGAHHGFQADVTGLREQHSTEADGQVRDARVAGTDVGKCMGKPRARVDLQEDFGEIDPWEPRQHLRAERQQAGGLLQFVEPSQREGVPTLDLFHPDGGIGGEVRHSPLIGRIELMGERLQRWLGRVRMA